MTKALYYIGLMSGTSADGIDLALIDCSTQKPQLISKCYTPYDTSIRQKIQSLYTPSINEIDKASSLNVVLAKLFADSINSFLAKEKLTAEHIIAIGNHGQTIRHRPTISTTIAEPFTLQLGCNQTLATLTGIRVIGDFRTKDMVLGGQGAPLVPAFHQAMFSQINSDVFIINIGGIANITFLPAKNSDKSISGFDTGPGNALMDDWYQKHNKGFFDKEGQWGESGNVNEALITRMLEDNYFKTKGPKSTGREYFNMAWLEKTLTSLNLKHLTSADIQATLTRFTACTISDGIRSLSHNAQLYLCGGGTLNSYLVKLLQLELPEYLIQTTHVLGVDFEALEAMAFAWFAYAYDKKIPGNIPAVTGAKSACCLGICFEP